MIDVSNLVHCGNPAHPNMYKTLDLLCLYDSDGEPVYFIVEGVGNVTDENPLDDEYLYNEHTCPTNYIPIEAIFTKDDDDPHGVFDYICSRWMTAEYADLEADCNTDEYLRNLFPETTHGPIIDGELAAKMLA